MATKRIRRGRFHCPGLTVLSLVLFCLHLHAQAGPQWRLIPVEVDGEKNTIVADFAIGADGIPWAALSQPRGTLCYWQEGQWHKIPGEFSFEPYQIQFHVSPAGRVYLGQIAPEGSARGRMPSKPHFGALYLLDDKRAEYTTEYYYDMAHFPPPLFFDSKGRIWNWGEMSLARFENGQWERVEASLGPYTQAIEDVSGNVYFFGKALSYCRDGQITANARPLSFPWEQPSVKGYLWGRDKAFFFSGSNMGAVVIDLNTLTPSDILHSEPLPPNVLREAMGRRQRGRVGPRANMPSDIPLLARSSLYDAFRDRQGDVWVLAWNQSTPGYHYIKIRAPDNEIEERLETGAIDWGAGMGGDRKPVLCARDGTIYFGGIRSGEYIYRDGVLTRMDWRQGLAINETHWVYEHPDGTIWFASRRMGVAVYDPRGVPGTGPTSPFQISWEEYPLATAPMLKDFEGRLWCYLKDHPGKISRWDGRTWEHVGLGSGPIEELHGLWIDNLQRLLAWGFIEYKPVWFRLANGRTDQFADFKEMVLDSVRTGSREFKSGARQSLGPLVIGDREIWCMDSSIWRLMRYDGQAWHEVKANPSRTSLLRHKDGQVLIATDGKFETLDRGQVVEFTDEHTRKREYLLGESGLQPFDEQVYEERKAELFPARQVERTLYVFERLNDFQALTEDNIPAGATKLGEYLDHIWLAPGGFWAHNDNLLEIRRYYKGLLLPVDLTLTPVAGDLYGGGCDILEDSAGDLWIRRHNTLFRAKRPQLETQITAPQDTQCNSPTVRVSFTGTTAGGESEPLLYAWRLDGGPWAKVSEQNYADLEFVQSGVHEFEVTAIGSMGNLDTTPAVLKLDVTLPIPEVRIVSAPRDVVTDLDVAIGYEVVKRAQGSKLSFQWRIDGGPWHDTQETTVRPSGLEDGEHLFEVRAVENNKYVQTPPASARFTLKVDYEKAILAAIEGLRSPDYGQREAAARRLVSLGRRSVPYLKKALGSANDDTRWWIQAVLDEIEK